MSRPVGRRHGSAGVAGLCGSGGTGGVRCTGLGRIGRSWRCMGLGAGLAEPVRARLCDGHWNGRHKSESHRSSAHSAHLARVGIVRTPWMALSVPTTSTDVSPLHALRISRRIEPGGGLGSIPAHLVRRRRGAIGKARNVEHKHPQRCGPSQGKHDHQHGSDP